ncbi:alpha-N-arabinofuranosidase [Pseudoduganella lurida]|uniref:Alpha-N-arabinofuranosidase n=1 Tax=Pseudoduganella lurida TaxID=1036180 RepID=A0A562RG77_9BURK|nr:glycoside hydrolase family 43 protein [Pseudoduganella lurida]TWI67426.1 alpha-N-arabinofuranosidase [Pseudoduganella lurida]
MRAGTVLRRAPLAIVIAAALAACASPGIPGEGNDGAARFERFSYTGRSQDAVQAGPGEYRNPILPGYYPDPSVARVGDDYYLINSSFTNFPGLPLFRSRDLVNWQQIANVLDRPSQFSFQGIGSSRGIYAPDISYRDGLFYVVTTCVDCGGNAVLTATDPAGPWSEPHKLAFGGIDPSIFWDSDGKAYIVHNDAPAETPRYDGHRAIWLQEFDPKAMQVVGPRTLLVNGGVDLATKPIWIEGPHVFRRGRYYYLMAAEGGTGDRHSEVIFRSTSVRGPFEPYRHNPILSQRNLRADRPDAVTSAGHAKLVETRDGQWWATFLATRPYEGDLYNIGRETFLLPVTWKDDWPVILEDGKPIPLAARKPALPEGPRSQLPSAGDTSYIDEFDGNRLAAQWIGVRTPAQPFYRVAGGGLVLRSAGELGDLARTPAFIARRQQHHSATVATSLHFQPVRDGDRAGLVAYQSDASHLFYGLTRVHGQTVVAAYARQKGQADRLLASAPVTGAAVDLEMIAEGGRMRFRYTAGGAQRELLADADITFLSTSKAGGFTGTLIGPYVWRAAGNQ